MFFIFIICFCECNWLQKGNWREIFWRLKRNKEISGNYPLQFCNCAPWMWNAGVIQSFLCIWIWNPNAIDNNRHDYELSLQLYISALWFGVSLTTYVDFYPTVLSTCTHLSSSWNISTNLSFFFSFFLNLSS